MHRRQSYDDQEDEPDSPSSWEDAKVSRASSKKSRRSVEKRVVSVPIADVERSKSRGEVYPPSDSWAWRKYGQKPIKGSPYPRGYYRCSSSKGCPARKQVERSRVDPTKLLITYACDHNHRNDAVSKTHKKKTPADPVPPKSSASLDLSHVELPALHDPTNGCHWLDDVALFDMGVCSDADEGFDVGFTMDEEDESLFGDLGDLPDGAVGFRRTTSTAVIAHADTTYA